MTEEKREGEGIGGLGEGRQVWGRLHPKVT